MMSMTGEPCIPAEVDPTNHPVSLDLRVANLEKQYASMHALLSAELGRTPPMELGNVFFSPGDPIPSKSQTDLLDGMIYSFRIGAQGYKFPYAFRKNLSGKTLKAGDAYESCTVDKTLRAPCEPNNFCYMEI